MITDKRKDIARKINIIVPASKVIICSRGEFDEECVQPRRSPTTFEDISSNVRAVIRRLEEGK